MPTPQKNNSSPAISRKLVDSAGAQKAPEPLDADALRALAWLHRGKSQVEIVYDEAAPEQDPDDLAKFKPVSYRRER